VSVVGEGVGNRRRQASIFGVGAPEAFVIGVVALLVFGPKGLADAARGLGQTLRAFQPTIKELQVLSRHRPIHTKPRPPALPPHSLPISAIYHHTRLHRDVKQMEWLTTGRRVMCRRCPTSSRARFSRRSG
jgi:TatA/E family protein of Tat protein translocase